MENNLKKLLRRNKSEILGVVILLFIFIISAYFSQIYSQELKSFLMLKSYWGATAYVLLGIVATVVAPVTTLPLLPVAVALWGPLITAALSIFGWTLGSLIAFLLARIFGRPLIKKLVDVKELERWELAIGKENRFWVIVALRMAIPVDVLSYAIGLFSSIHWLPYLVATFIGIIPFAFVFSFASTLSVVYQIAVIILASLVLGIAYFKMRTLMQAKHRD